MRINKFNMGGQMQGQPGQMQGDPQGGGAPQDVNALLEMLSQIPPEVTVGEVMEKLLKRGGETPGANIPPSPSMPMQ